MAKVESTTITVLIGIALFIGGIAGGSFVIESQPMIGYGLAIGLPLFGVFLIIATLFPKMFKKR